MFYAVVMREKNSPDGARAPGTALRVRLSASAVMTPAHGAFTGHPYIGIVPTIRYVSSAAGLPIDVAQILACSEPAPLTSSPQIRWRILVCCTTSRPSYLMSSRPAVPAGRGPASDSPRGHPRRALPLRGGNNRIGARAMSAPAGLAAYLVGFPVATARFFNCADASRRTRRHTGTRSFTSSLVPRHEAHEIGRAARIMHHARLPRRTIDTALLCTGKDDRARF